MKERVWVLHQIKKKKGPLASWQRTAREAIVRKTAWPSFVHKKKVEIERKSNVSFFSVIGPVRVIKAAVNNCGSSPSLTYLSIDANSGRVRGLNFSILQVNGLEAWLINCVTIDLSLLNCWTGTRWFIQRTELVIILMDNQIWACFKWDGFF